MLMHEWMNNANINTMNKRKQIISMHETIEWLKHEMHKHNTYTHFKHTIHIEKDIITYMYTIKVIKEGWNNRTNLDDLGLTCWTREQIVINNKNNISWNMINYKWIEYKSFWNFEKHFQDLLHKASKELVRRLL